MTDFEKNCIYEYDGQGQTIYHHIITLSHAPQNINAQLATKLKRCINVWTQVDKPQTMIYP